MSGGSQDGQGRRIALYSLVLFLAIAMVFILISLWIEMSSIRTQRNALVESQEDLVQTEQSVVSAKVDRLTANLTYLRDLLDIEGYGSGDDRHVVDNWISFADHHGIYDQIRLIDTEGNEVIRVDYSDSGSYAVPADELQNMADRSYFSESMGLQPNKIYISRLDLNVEHGSVEQPIKPTIRLCTPYYDGTGALRGIVCVNYLANDMLSLMDQVASAGEGDVCLLNADGYWLYDEYDDSMAWAFMYADRAGESFASYYPDEWRTIGTGTSGHLISGNGLFTYADVLTGDAYVSKEKDYSLVLGEGDWSIVSRIAPEDDYAELLSWSTPRIALYLAQTNIVTLIVILVLSVALSTLYVDDRARKARVRYFSEYDEMTGIFNRRAGLDRLSRGERRKRNGETRVCLCFIDVNGLKEVNDTLGHEAGDELIVTVADVVKDSIRDGDYLVRMGGDEFLIVFEGTDEETAEKVWKRIVGTFDRINAEEGRAYPIGVSHGIAELGPDDSIDDVIHEADNRMYEEKRAMKSQGTTDA